jgi:hypothetical protein
MPVAEEVIEIVRILTDEGFGTVAAEILEEMSLGREEGTYPGDQELSDEEFARLLKGSRLQRDSSSLPLPLAPEEQTGPLIELDDGRRVPLIYDRAPSVPSDTAPARIEMSASEQIEYAMEILNQRLVEPMLHLAQAERIAGLLTAPDEIGEQAGRRVSPSGQEPISIVLDYGQRDGVQRLVKRAEPGSVEAAADLGKLIQSIRDLAGGRT